MSDFDVNNPSPDDGHEAIRVAVVQAIEDLGYTADDAVLGLDMADTLFALLDSVMAANDALSARLEALEAAAVPPADEDPEAPPTDPTPEVAP